MSLSTIKKAEKMLRQGHVVELDQDLFQVRSSSNEENSYMVTGDSCDCLGFKNYYRFHHGKGRKATCSHLEAVRLYLLDKATKK